MNPSPPRSTIPDAATSPADPGPGAAVHVFVVSAYESHHAELFTFLARATRNRSTAEGLLEETYVRLAKEARGGHPPLDVRGWLFRAATTLVIGGPRQQSRALRWLAGGGRREEDDIDPPSPEVGVLGRERAAELELVLRGLSADARVALLLSGAGFSGEAIAAAMGRSSAATRSLLARARARVRLRRDLFAGEAR